MMSDKDNNISEPANEIVNNETSIRNKSEIKSNDFHHSPEASTGLGEESLQEDQPKIAESDDQINKSDDIHRCTESSDAESDKRKVEEPFQGQLKLEKCVQSGNETTTEYRYFGEIKVTGEDSFVVKNKINVQFYFALQILNEKITNHMPFQIRQGDTFEENWLFLMCCNEPDKSNRCSVVFIAMNWFTPNREQLIKTGFHDNIFSTDPGILKIYKVDDLLTIAPDSNNSDKLNIFKKTESLPKLIEYRLPLLKVLKSAIYHSNEIIDFLQEVPLPKSSKPKAKVGSREPCYTKQSNALKNLDLNNNFFSNATRNILPKPSDDAKRSKRCLKLPASDPYQLEIDKTASQLQKKSKQQANRKNKRKQQLIVVGTNQVESSAAANEVVILKQQLLELQNSMKLNSSSPILQAEAVTNKTKRNSKKPLVVTPAADEMTRKDEILDVSIDRVNEQEDPVVYLSPEQMNLSVTDNNQKEKRKGKRKGKQDKHSALIISLLEKNNLQLEEMKNRINVLEGNGSVGINRSNLLDSQSFISTPLIDKYFNSPLPQNANSNSQQNNNFNNTTPYYAQNPYYIHQTPQNLMQNNWSVTTPQGVITGQNNQNYSQSQGVMLPCSSQGMVLRQQQQPQGNFFDYAILDYFSGRR